MNNIEKYNRAKFFFIGWIIAIIPYTLILMMVNSVKDSDPAFTYITLVLLIVIPIINGYNLSKQASEASDD